MTVPDSIHNSVFAEIEARITALRSGAPAAARDRAAWAQDEVEAELAQLMSDRHLLLAHWWTSDGAAPTELAGARTCGQPQPCPQVLGLASKYGFL